MIIHSCREILREPCQFPEVHSLLARACFAFPIIFLVITWTRSFESSNIFLTHPNLKFSQLLKACSFWISLYPLIILNSLCPVISYSFHSAVSRYVSPSPTSECIDHGAHALSINEGPTAAAVGYAPRPRGAADEETSPGGSVAEDSGALRFTPTNFRAGLVPPDEDKDCLFLHGDHKP